MNGRRYREQARLGFAMIAAALFLFAALIAGAIYADAARGITIGESLDSAGL